MFKFYQLQYLCHFIKCYLFVIVDRYTYFQTLLTQSLLQEILKTHQSMHKSIKSQKKTPSLSNHLSKSSSKAPRSLHRCIYSLQSLLHNCLKWWPQIINRSLSTFSNFLSYQPNNKFNRVFNSPHIYPKLSKSQLHIKSQLLIQCRSILHPRCIRIPNPLRSHIFTNPRRTKSTNLPRWGRSPSLLQCLISIPTPSVPNVLWSSTPKWTLPIMWPLCILRLTCPSSPMSSTSAPCVASSTSRKLTGRGISRLCVPGGLPISGVLSVRRSFTPKLNCRSIVLKLTLYSLGWFWCSRIILWSDRGFEKIHYIFQNIFQGFLKFKNTVGEVQKIQKRNEIKCVELYGMSRPVLSFICSCSQCVEKVVELEELENGLKNSYNNNMLSCFKISHNSKTCFIYFSQIYWTEVEFEKEI